MNINNSESSISWTEILKAPVNFQLNMFRAAAKCNYPGDVKSGFRAFAADLFSRELISIDEYVSIFGGNALNYLMQLESGAFHYMKTGADASQLAAIYSRAKYGGLNDTQFLAQQLIDYLCDELDQPSSQWLKLFQNAKLCEDSVVMMTTGWRNVPSAANILYEIVVEEVNLKLAHMALPTIISVKLPRIAPPCENYASLSTEEREHINLIQDHVIPAENFYRWSGVHVIFGDDVLITGSTADKVLYESMLGGAKSFRALYPIALDPCVALSDASIEDRLNSVVIKQELDDTLAELLAAPGYQPTLRTLRLLFGDNNADAFEAFLPKVQAKTWLKLYKAALGNEFLSQTQCTPSLLKLRNHLTESKLLSADGRTINNSYFKSV